MAGGPGLQDKGYDVYKVKGKSEWSSGLGLDKISGINRGPNGWVFWVDDARRSGSWWSMRK